MFRSGSLIVALLAFFVQPADAQRQREPSIQVLEEVRVTGRCTVLSTGVEAPYDGVARLLRLSSQPQPVWAAFLDLPRAELERHLAAGLDALMRGRRYDRPPGEVTLVNLSGPPQPVDMTVEGVGTDRVDERPVDVRVRCTLRQR